MRLATTNINDDGWVNMAQELKGLGSLGVTYNELFAQSSFQKSWDSTSLGEGLVTGISTDTRNLFPGDLFVALRGENFNGEDFAFKALEMGAGAAIVPIDFYEKYVDSQKVLTGRLIGTEDTLFALGELAKAIRDISKVKVIAITGSVAKTTVKELIKNIFLAQYHSGVEATLGNLNNLIGVPLTIFKISKDTKYLIVEMGANHFGEIARLTEIAEPNLGLITKTERAHLEFFKDRAGVARAKAELFRNMNTPGAIKVVNLSDPYIKSLAGGGNIFTYGTKDSGAQLRLVKRTQLKEGQLVLLESELLKGGKLEIETSMLGAYSAENILASAAVALAWGISDEAIARGISETSAPEGRGIIVKFKEFFIIDDSYNANPGSMEAALGALMERNGAKSAVLGDMLELGEGSFNYHRELGRICGAAKLKALSLAGKFAPFVRKGAIAAGMDEGNIKVFDGPQAALNWGLAQATKGEYVLVKGSHGAGLGEDLKKLLKV
jgi:UDP-N-acetylmuramoyl-tripeptide--D-alanyl-D-alanine ligase